MNDWNGIKGNIRRNIREKGTDHTQQKIVVSFPFLFQEIYIYYIYRIVGWFKDSWGTHCSFIQRQKNFWSVGKKYDRKNDVVDIYSLRFDGKGKYFSSNKGTRKCFKENCSHYCNEEFSFKFSAIDH